MGHVVLATNSPTVTHRGETTVPIEAKQGSQEQEGGVSVICRETTRRPKREGHTSPQHYRAILERDTESERSHYCQGERPEHCTVTTAKIWPLQWQLLESTWAT